MKWPTLCIDGFFEDPDSVIKWANTLEYKKTKGLYPGERTDFINKLDLNFFKRSTKKIVGALYPGEIQNPGIFWQAEQHFQKINTKEHKLPGFVHQDLFAEFTAIVYLTDEEEAGTSIYKRINEPNPDYDDIKKQGYSTLKYTKEFKKELKRNRDNHQKVLQFAARKNRLVLFDSAQHHGVDHFGSKVKERLTLITFFTHIWKNNGGLKYHVDECTRI
jgi:hypothetical protein